MLPDEGLTIELTSDPSDFAVCAHIMAGTDPWITLGMDFDYCLKAFDGSFKEVFVLRDEAEIIGFVVMQIQGTFKGYIQTICVNNTRRGAGLGSKMLRFCEERILSYSPNIFICVSSFNKKALQLYKNFGFELIGELKDFIKPGFTELLLRKTAGPISNYKTSAQKHQVLFCMRIKLKNVVPGITLCIALLLASKVSNAQVKDSVEKKAVLVREVDEAINNAIADNKIPGAVIQVKKDSTVVYTQAYGDAQKFNYNHELLPVPNKMTTGTLFDLASLTKVVGTTTSIMLLVDRGQIKVDDPVSKYVPAFGSSDKAAITIRHLLTHTAGILEWYPLYYRASNKQETFKLIGELPLRFPVGAQRKYSDLGFTVLGEIVEIVSGLSLDKFEEQNIFIPLGMKNTLFNPLKTGRDFKIAATSFGNPYETRMVHDPSMGFQFKEINPDQWNGWRHYVLKGEVNDGNAWYAEGGVAGAAGLFSTVEDLQKLVDMLMNKGKVGDRQFISENTINTFLTKDKFNNGLGWMMDPVNSFMKNAPEGSFGHTGFTGTSISVVPAEGLSIILLINRQQMGLQPSGEYYNPNPIRAAVFKAAMEYCR